jgi:predicted acylesterase/phospholipase RssA
LQCLDVTEFNAKNPGILDRRKWRALHAHGSSRYSWQPCSQWRRRITYQIAEDHVLRDFYDLTPEKFSNKTTGVTPRRWMVLSNPRLANLLTARLGHGWIHDLEKLRRIESMIDDLELAQELRAIKHHNKQPRT